MRNKHLAWAICTLLSLLVDGTPSAQVEDGGQANPDFDFRYDGGAYVFNLDTGGLSSGTWELQFTVNGGSIVYTAAFDVR